MPTHPGNRRRLTDVKALQREGFVDTVDDDGSILCSVDGPADTPYADHRWQVRIQLPAEYPFKSPSIGFVHPLFHPNVDWASGSICLNALNQEWTPVYNLVVIVKTLLPQLLAYPNPDDPLNNDAAALLQEDPAAFRTRCGELHEERRV